MPNVPKPPQAPQPQTRQAPPQAQAQPQAPQPQQQTTQGGQATLAQALERHFQGQAAHGLNLGGVDWAQIAAIILQLIQALRQGGAAGGTTPTPS